MPVKSYILLPTEGKKNELIQALKKFNSCSSYPAENRDIVIVVTDTADEAQEEKLMEHINAIPALKHITLVSGFMSNQA
ncbi:hypothetical protein RCC89_10560 [Cytophagaceae bacterium ABcell3]|nr:hypothetical protein RCC89_10560 [Cytophagaceae bacterium ABcell3]